MATTLAIILKEVILLFKQVIPMDCFPFLVVAAIEYLNCSIDSFTCYLKQLANQVHTLKLITTTKVMVQAKEVIQLEF